MDRALFPGIGLFSSIFESARRLAAAAARPQAASAKAGSGFLTFLTKRIYLDDGCVRLWDSPVVGDLISGAAADKKN